MDPLDTLLANTLGPDADRLAADQITLLKAMLARPRPLRLVAEEANVELARVHLWLLEGAFWQAAQKVAAAAGRGARITTKLAEAAAAETLAEAAVEDVPAGRVRAAAEILKLAGRRSRRTPRVRLPSPIHPEADAAVLAEALAAQRAFLAKQNE